MLAAVDFILVEGQNFENRSVQYNVVDRLNPVIFDKLVVKHKITKEKFLMKMIPHDAQPGLKE